MLFPQNILTVQDSHGCTLIIHFVGMPQLSLSVSHHENRPLYYVFFNQTRSLYIAGVRLDLLNHKTLFLMCFPPLTSLVFFSYFSLRSLLLSFDLRYKKYLTGMLTHLAKFDHRSCCSL